MGAASTVMLATMAGLQLASSYQQSESQKLQGDYQKSMFDLNARMAGIQADDAIDRGNEAANRVRSQGTQIEGAQKASLAAQGIDINSESAVDVQAQTRAFNQLDVLTVKNNAWREAWGHRAEADEFTNRGGWAERGAEFESQTTLLAGGLRAFDSGMQGWSASDTKKRLDKEKAKKKR